PVRGNDVAGKLRPPFPIRISGEWIKDRHIEGAEVAVADGVGGYRRQQRSTRAPARSLVVSEKEELVLRDRSAQRPAKLVPAQRGRPCGLAEGVASIENVVLQVLEKAAMKLVAARFGLHLDDRTTGLRELRVKVARGLLHLRHRVHRWVNDDNAEHGVVIVHAVHGEVGGAKLLTVVVNLDAALRILTGGVLPRRLLRARQQELQRGQIPVQ